MTDAPVDLAPQLELATARRTLAPLAPLAVPLVSAVHLEVMEMTLVRPMLVPIRTFALLSYVLRLAMAHISSRSNMGNKADPRIDSDRDGRSGGGLTGTTGSGTTGGTTGSGQTTATGAPSTQEKAHNSSLLNRLDPRVKTDSQGNPTH